MNKMICFHALMVVPFLVLPRVRGLSCDTRPELTTVYWHCDVMDVQWGECEIRARRTVGKSSTSIHSTLNDNEKTMSDYVHHKFYTDLDDVDSKLSSAWIDRGSKKVSRSFVCTWIGNWKHIRANWYFIVDMHIPTRWQQGHGLVAGQWVGQIIGVLHCTQ